MRNICKACLGKVWFLLKRASYRIRRPKDAVDTLYSILYHEVHDLDEAREIKGHRTSDAFDAQWKNLPEGEYLLSDPWFRENVDTILAEHELLLPKEWFFQAGR